MALYRTILAIILSASLLALATVPLSAAKAARELRVETTVPQYGYSMGVGFGSLWMMSGGKVVRIDVGENSTTDLPIEGVIGILGGPSSRGMAVGEGAIWVPDVDRSVIYKIDPQTNHVVKRIAADMVGGGGGSIGAGMGSVWVITGGSSNELSRLSAESGAEEARVPLPSRSSAALVAFGSVWITGTGNDELYRIDPTSNEIAATIELNSRPRFLAAGEGSVWVFNEGTGTVQRIDGKDSKLLATIETEAVGKGSITVGGGFVWVGTRLLPVIQIDPRTNSVLGKFNLAEMAEYSTIAYAGGSLWVSGSSIRRIKIPE